MNPKIRLHKKALEYLKEINNFDYTNAEIVKNIDNFGIYVDEILTKSRQSWVYPGQELNLDHWPKRDHGDFFNIKTLQENPDFLLIYKPKGVVVEAGAGHQVDNLVNWLEKTYNQNFYLVHRLDKDTQGLLLIAKSQEALVFFQDQFRARSITKKYLCVVDGILDKVWNVKAWQSREKQNMLRQKLFWGETEALAYDPKSRESESIIFPKFICPQTNQSLVEVQIKTGRMHQIRLHCEGIGFPLSAELVYKHTKSVSEKILNTENSPVKNFYPLKIAKELDKDAFLNLKTEIFGETEYCLLSNYLTIQTPENAVLGIQYVNLDLK